MKINSAFHALVFLMAGLVFGMPFVTLAQQDSVEDEAVAAAEADAEADTDKNFWFFVGCIGNLLGLAYANYDVPSAPASRLLGKSPEYVAFYSDAYMMKAKKIQTDYAIRGCITNNVVSVIGCLGYGCLVAGAAAADE